MKSLEGIEISLAKKCIDKVIDISRVCYRMIVIKVLVQGIITSVISVYASQCGLDDSQKDGFYDSLINVVRKLGKEIVVIAVDFTGHIESNPEDYEEQHGGYGYGVRNKGEGFLSFAQL